MFISLEGIEGSGKSTLARGLASALASGPQARQSLITREPGGSGLGLKLRALLLDTASKPSPKAELFLFLADRAQHVAEVIRPALSAGQVVICDRYIDSTLVYQGLARKLDIAPSALRELNNVAVDGLWPHLTLLLDIDVSLGLARARGRLEASGKGQCEGRFEAEADLFHHTVRQGFLQAAKAETQRIYVLDAAQSPQQLVDQALGLIRAHPAFGPGA